MLTGLVSDDCCWEPGLPIAVVAQEKSNTLPVYGRIGPRSP